MGDTCKAGHLRLPPRIHQVGLGSRQIGYREAEASVAATLSWMAQVRDDRDLGKGLPVQQEGAPFQTRCSKGSSLLILCCTRAYRKLR